MCMMARNLPTAFWKWVLRKPGRNWVKRPAWNAACRYPVWTCTTSGICIQCPGWSQLVHGDNETAGLSVNLIKHANQIWYTKSVIKENVLIMNKKPYTTKLITKVILKSKNAILGFCHSSPNMFPKQSIGCTAQVGGCSTSQG